MQLVFERWFLTCHFTKLQLFLLTVVFSIYKIILSADSNNFTFSFLICMATLSCFWSHRKLQLFYIQYDVSCGIFVDGLYYVECFYYIQTVKVFFTKGFYILSNSFTAITKMIMWFLFFILLTWWIIFIDLHMLNHICIQGTQPMWSWCIIL